MKNVFVASEVFEGLDDETVERIASLATRQTLEPGEGLFALGEDAERMYIVLDGGVDLCIPLSIRGQMRDVSVESKGPGSALGWSAFVKPYGFRMSARAAKRSEVAAVARTDLSRLFADDAATKFRFMQRIAEITAERMLRVQALWVRELQRSVAPGSSATPS